MNITITDAKPEHINECTTTLAQSQLGREYFDDSDEIHQLLLEGLSGGYLSVAFGDGPDGEPDQFLGFMWVVPNGAFYTYPFLHLIAVKEELRGQGIGSQLFDLLEESVFADHPKIFLVVAEFDVGPKRLYESRGYVQVGTIEDLYKEGVAEQLMMKVKDGNG
ncbi:MAG: N-acetyltransferase [Desulfobacula sp.]|jgi:ribosomal protein S18 acetylase RimI-like enzyme|nr:N-acetyltransferase [Desulfobacula sp.]